MVEPESSFPAYDTQMQTVGNKLSDKQFSVALIKDDDPRNKLVTLTPNAVKKLTDNHIQVWVQRDYSAHSSFTDLDYAEVGAEIVDEFAIIARLSQLLIKFSRFTVEEVALMTKNQLILSASFIDQLSTEYLKSISEKKITAIGFSLITNNSGKSALSEIIQNNTNHFAASFLIEKMIFPIISSLIIHNIKAAIQTNPSLLQSVYCFQGELCNKQMADYYDLMWKDILSLCWDLN